MSGMRKGQAPFGFRWQGGALVLLREEAEVRPTAFHSFLKIGSMAGVARELNGQGKRTRRGGLWSDVQVTRLLECSSAIGRYQIAQKGGGNIDNPGSDGHEAGEVFECEPLISREVWERTRTVLDSRRKGRASGEHSLAGLVGCRCGEKMRSLEQASQFGCASCRTSVTADDLEAVFAADFLALISAHPALVAALAEDSPARKTAAELAHLDHELETLTRKRDAAERMFAERVVSKSRFEELHQPLEDAIRETERRRQTRRLRGSDTLADAAPSEAWNKMWLRWPAARRHRVIATFVSAFTVGADEVEISYLLPEPLARQNDASIQHSSAPTNQTSSGNGPRYIRLPKAGENCPITGLSRAKMNELILPNARNNHRPPVISKSLRQPHQARGVRLILLESLLAYLKPEG